jgi:hypothetical protein
MRHYRFVDQSSRPVNSIKGKRKTPTSVSLAQVTIYATALQE